MASTDAHQQATEHKTKGNAAFQSGDFNTAVSEFSKAIELNPSDHVFYSNRSGAYASLRQYNKALDDANKCIELNPKFTKGYGRAATAYYGLDDLNAAKSEYERGLAVDSTNKQLQDGLTEVNNALERQQQQGGAGDNPMAKMFGEGAIEKLAADSSTRHLLADPSFRRKLDMLRTNPNALQSLIGDQQIMQAMGVLLGIGSQGFRTVDPNDPDAMRDITGKDSNDDQKVSVESDDDDDMPELVANNKPSTQQSRPSSQQQSKPQSPPVQKPEESAEDKEHRERKLQAEQFKKQANDLYKQRKFDDALQYYNKAVELDPTNITLYNNIAAVYYEMKQYEKAIEYCQKAIDVQRQHGGDYKAIARSYERMGNAYTQMGDLTKAIDAYERSLLEEHSDKIRNLVKKLKAQKSKQDEESYINPELSNKHKEAGNQLFKDQKYQDAIAEYSEAIKRDPTNYKVYSNRAGAYAKLMDWGRALDDCEQCIKADPSFVKPYIRKGNIQHFLKQYHKAIKTWETALQLDPQSSEAKEGKMKTVMAINSGDRDKSAAERNMADPEIQAILQSPTMNKVLADLQSDPGSAQKYMQDPDIRKQLETLIAAGVLATK